MDRAHARKARVQGDEQVEALGFAHLADDEPVGPHAQGLLDEAAQRDLARPFEVRLPALHRDEVADVEVELERLLDGHHSVRGARARHQRVEHRRLAGVRRSRDEDVRTREHAHAEELRGLPGERVELDELLQGADALLELPHVDGPVRARHVRDRDVQPRPVGQGRVDERRRQVDPTARVLQHPLDEVAHLSIGQHERGQLGHAGSRDEHARRRVDPDLLDRRVVEERLKRAVPGDGCHDLARRARLVAQRRVRSGERPFGVPAHLLVRVPRRERLVAGEIDALTEHPPAHPLGDGAHGIGHALHLGEAARSACELIHMPAPAEAITGAPGG